MTAMVFHQSNVTQHLSLLSLISYCAIAFSFALVFTKLVVLSAMASYSASACWLSHMKQ